MATCNLIVGYRQTYINDVTGAGSTNLLDSGTIKIYTGTIPATPETAIGTQVLLGTLTFGAPAFGSATAATPSVATAAAITNDSSADATGVAVWARIASAAGVAVMDVDVGIANATIIMPSVAVVAGAPIAITSFTLRA